MPRIVAVVTDAYPTGSDHAITVSLIVGDERRPGCTANFRTTDPATIAMYKVGKRFRLLPVEE